MAQLVLTRPTKKELHEILKLQIFNDQGRFTVSVISTHIFVTQ